MTSPAVPQPLTVIMAMTGRDPAETATNSGESILGAPDPPDLCHQMFIPPT